MSRTRRCWSARLRASRAPGGNVRLPASVALWEPGPAAREALPALGAALQDSSRYVRGCAPLAIQRVNAPR